MNIVLDGPYQDIGDGDTLNIEKDAVFFLACCDCGLVHRVESHTDAKLTFTVDKRKTGQVKRWLKKKKS